MVSSLAALRNVGYGGAMSEDESEKAGRMAAEFMVTLHRTVESETAERIAAWLDESARESIIRGGICASENASSMLLASSLIRGGEWKR